ncbi:leucyl aminopeptidase [Brucella ceti TE28753-12]|nr:leucyl aminopeptidase [Brucella ceti TE28753-12]
MSAEIISQKSAASRPIWFVAKNALDEAALPESAAAWAKANGFDGEAGRVLVLPGRDGAIAGACLAPARRRRTASRSLSPESLPATCRKAIGILKASRAMPVLPHSLS